MRSVARHIADKFGLSCTISGHVVHLRLGDGMETNARLSIKSAQHNLGRWACLYDSAPVNRVLLEILCERWHPLGVPA